MKSYSNKLVFDYVNGNDIYGYNIDDLEDNLHFMIDVIRFTKDKNMYELCSDNVKNNYVFVKFMVKMFKEDVEFVTSLVLSYLNTKDEEDITYKELLALVSNLKGDSDNLLTLKLKREIFKTIEFGSLDLTIKELEPKVKQEVGMGFVFVIDNYGNSNILKNFFAEEFISKIFERDNITLEELIHKTVKSFNQIQKQGINTFLINFIKGYDTYLADYICNHIELLDDIKRKIIVIGNNWDNYIEKINIRRFNILYQEMYRYIDDHGLILRFSVYELLVYVMKKNNLEDIFNKYELEQQGLTDCTPKIDENKMNLPELKFLKYVSDLVNELFSEDVIDKQETQSTKKESNGYSKVLKFNNNTK